MNTYAPLLMLALMGCPKSTPIEHPPMPAAPPVAAESAALDVDAAMAQAETVAKKLSLQPAPFGPGPELAVLPEGTPEVSILWYLDPEEPEPTPIEGFDLLHRRLPWAELGEDGTLHIRYETRKPVPAGSLYIGMAIEEDPLSPPRHRKTSVEKLEGTSVDHQIHYPLSKVLKDSYDVNGVAERGWGVISWRVEQFDPERGATRIHDGVTGFRIDADGTFHQQPAPTIGPSLHQLTEESVVIAIETDVPTAAAVSVAGVGTVGSQVAATRHELKVDGLKPGQKYDYTVALSNGAEASVTPVRTFQTRIPDTPVRVAIASDSRSGAGPGRERYHGVNADAVHRLFTDATRRGAEALFFPGDLIDGYTTQPDDFDLQVRSWLQATSPIAGQLPIYTGMGNHEVLVDAWTDRGQVDKQGEDSAEVHFAALMANPTNAPEPEADNAPPYDEAVYSWDIGPVHFVMLDTNYWFAMTGDYKGVHDPRWEGRGNREGFLMDGQLDWLTNDLTAARMNGAEHIVVMAHEPAFPVGGHAEDAMWWHGEIPEVNTMRERFWSILAEHQVLAYVSGDEHNFSRSLIGPETVSTAKGSVWSIISGGCGAPYYAQKTPEPYVDRVQKFSAQQHYTLWIFDGDQVLLQVIGITGEVIEELDLVAERARIEAAEAAPTE